MYLDDFGNKASLSQLMEQINPGETRTDDKHIKRFAVGAAISILSILDAAGSRLLCPIPRRRHVTDITLHR